MAPGAHGTDVDAANQDHVTAEWRDEHLPSFFARWHRQNAALLQETTAAIIAAAAINSPWMLAFAKSRTRSQRKPCHSVASAQSGSTQTMRCPIAF